MRIRVIGHLLFRRRLVGAISLFSLSGCFNSNMPAIDMEKIDSPNLVSLVEAIKLANGEVAKKLAQNAAGTPGAPTVDDFDKKVVQRMNPPDGTRHFSFYYYRRNSTSPVYYVSVDRQTGSFLIRGGLADD
ncbi:MAG: hypothetical protein AMXMBFR47_41350 [Planctomycetota bacterium]